MVKKKKAAKKVEKKTARKKTTKIQPLKEPLKINWRQYEGPKTCISMFVYGDVKAATHQCFSRDMSFVAKRTGQVSIKKQLMKEKKAKFKHDEMGNWDVGVLMPGPDALIERSRALVAKEFLKDPTNEVLLMIDHDITWNPPYKKDGLLYEGDLLHLARKAAETRSIVGGLVAKKKQGQGVATMWKDRGHFFIGGEGLVEVHYVGAAFTAYHRDVIQAITDTMEEIPPGYSPIFQTLIADHRYQKGLQLHLSEDWSLCERANKLGFKTWIATMPITGHIGEYHYRVVQDSQKEVEMCSPKIKFSLIHATRGRPEQALAVYEIWKKQASGKNEIEYIFSIDEDDKKTFKVPDDAIVVTGKSRGNVDAYNRGAYASTGDALIQLHDDVLPPKDWDLILSERMDTRRAHLVRVNDGGMVKQDKPWLIPILIGTRKYFQEQGYMYHPDFVSIYCDDHIGMKADKEGSVVNCPDIVFKHMWGGQQADSTYKRSYRKENWLIGEKVLKREKRKGFPNSPKMWKGA